MGQNTWGSIPVLVARGIIENRQAIVRIGFQPLIPEASQVQPSSTAIQFPVHEYRALIDTGAQRTCLGRKVIPQEGLRHHGKKPIQNVHGVEIHYLYLVAIGFFCERMEPDGEAGSKTYFGFDQPIEVIDIADNYWFDAIVGMDLLSRSELRIERNGTFSITF